MLAEVLGVSVTVNDRLREVERPWADGTFEESVARYVDGERIEGWESTDHVVPNLGDYLVSCSGERPIGVVTHGTAMTCLLLAGDRAKRARFWSELTVSDAWDFSQEKPTRLDCRRVHEMAGGAPTPCSNEIVITKSVDRASHVLSPALQTGPTFATATV